MILVTDLAEYFAQSYGIDPEITYLLDHREVYFVPIVNPDGRVYTEETGQTWTKKNRRDNGNGTFEGFVGTRGIAPFSYFFQFCTQLGYVRDGLRADWDKFDPAQKPVQFRIIQFGKQHLAGCTGVDI